MLLGAGVDVDVVFGGRTTVCEIGGAELTAMELGAAPVPCGSFGLKMVNGSP